MSATAAKFEQFEWLAHGLTVSSPSQEPSIHGTGEKPLDYQDRLGAIASMETQLAKSVTALIVFEGRAQSDYEYVRQHLANILIKNAIGDKKREPERIAMFHLAWLIARMVLDFALDPELEENYTAKGRLMYAGVKRTQMSISSYRQTWKPYENLMTIAIESAIDEASKAIEKYKNATYKEIKNNC
ncbi:hypothetical protein EC846_1529 [Acinetobacter sp. BIGb0102]|uniref:hypothetical protein n=1 Tax=Acinetobacter sp. BIGb0102 TaxID=2485131 RepID=UPI000F4FA525|nr:hypothetical protein [Acinetobacter sp. BIGb0102]RPE30828.1 hypothetical protein EC846_1529 [Acinetobacter sp. BIGb0102]